MHIRLIAALSCLGLTGCFSVLPNMTDRLSDASYDLNQASRFGRMDVALENVAKKSRDKFAKEHVEWGRAFRIVDSEVTGLGMTGEDGADVFVSVSWQRNDEVNLRVTHLKQHWANDKGTWRLASEERKGGDPGLLGEPHVEVEQPQEHAIFPTRVIRGE